ncbi:MAG: hypothetical protein LUQ65_09230 [Candidatus Helarchaeota archaeon]|nr:hypothetical protein [Candidatus Helarchaeota archaeon]
MTSDYKMYRRIMCCKIKKENVKRFITAFEEDGWQSNAFGKRGSKYAYIKNFPDKTRFHWRLYEIEDYFFFLIHHEPTFTGDIPFHISGLLSRFRSRKDDPQENEKLEMANYEKGREFFKDFMKNKGITEICDFRIDEDELRVFARLFGFISLKLTAETLIDDLTAALNAESNEEFCAIIEKLFQIMDFTPIQAQGTDFLVFESKSIKGFTLFIQRIKLPELNLKELSEIVKKYQATSTLLLTHKQDVISAEFSQKLAYLNIGIIQPSNFLKIFNTYKNVLISHEQFQQVFGKKGLIDATFIDETLQPENFSKFLKKTFELFSYLKEQLEWVHHESLEEEFVKRGFSKEELKAILNFLTNPLVNLVLKKVEKRRWNRDRAFYLAIKNFDEIQFRLKNMKKFLSELS